MEQEDDPHQWNNDPYPDPIEDSGRAPFIVLVIAITAITLTYVIWRRYERPRKAIPHSVAGVCAEENQVRDLRYATEGD